MAPNAERVGHQCRGGPPKGQADETYLPAEPSGSQTPPWFSGPQGNQSGARHFGPSPIKGTQASFRLADWWGLTARRAVRA